MTLAQFRAFTRAAARARRADLHAAAVMARAADKYDHKAFKQLLQTLEADRGDQ